MSTGQVESWAGTISEIGPLYPWVGSEVVWYVIALALWILWHVVQIVMEKRTHREEVRRYGDHDTLQRLVEQEQNRDETQE